jgi:hypothetical protein
VVVAGGFFLSLLCPGLEHTSRHCSGGGGKKGSPLFQEFIRKTWRKKKKKKKALECPKGMSL